MTTTDAAAVLGVTGPHVVAIVNQAGLSIRRKGRRILLNRSEVKALARERNQWISYAEAISITGFSRQAIEAAVRQRKIELRPDAGRRQAGLSRRSVVAWGLEEQERRTKALEERQARGRPTPTGPPNDGRAWMSAPDAAIVLGLSRARVGQLIAEERLPASMHNGRWWLQPQHVFSAANARSASRQDPSAYPFPHEPHEGVRSMGI